MNDLPVNVYSVASVREFDKSAIDGEGIPGYTLMQRAGSGLYAWLRQHYPDARHITVVCGAGNNAGDGYVVAKHALKDGRLARLVALSDPARLTGDALRAFEDYRSAGGDVSDFDNAMPSDTDLVVDAILGSGIARDVEGSFADAIAAINRVEAPVIAVDIPSGLNGDSGAVMGSAVRADATRTFVGLKTGLFLGDGPDLCGTLSFDALSIPSRCFAGIEPELRRVTILDVERCLPPRRPAAHKGNFGHVLIIGGGPGMPGAVRLTGEAALRSGAGRVSVATHPLHAASIAAGRPELMCHAIEQPGDLGRLMDSADVIAFGPGLGQSDWAKALYEYVSGCELPAVWDADALNWLARAPASMSQRIITPHPGEAARLLNCASADVQRDRHAAVRRLADRYGGVAVLKGAGTLIASGIGQTRLCSDGNPGMAAPGMGDALTGVIVALLAQGLEPFSAATIGAQVHASAGDVAARAGERGLMASDLIDALRVVVNP